MVGIGETRAELEATLRDIRAAGVEILTLGQYLQPTPHTCPSTAGSPPAEFAAYRDLALSLGFAHCEAGPLVRSSYHAHEHVRPAAVPAVPGPPAAPRRPAPTPPPDPDRPVCRAEIRPIGAFRP